MSVFSKRNALIGWATWVVGKRIFKGKSGAGGRSKRSMAAVAAALAAVGGVLFFWRSRKAPDESIGPIEPFEQPAEPAEQPTNA